MGFAANVGNVASLVERYLEAARRSGARMDVTMYTPAISVLADVGDWHAVSSLWRLMVSRGAKPVVTRRVPSPSRADSCTAEDKREIVLRLLQHFSRPRRRAGPK